MGTIIPYIKQPTRVFNTAQMELHSLKLTAGLPLKNGGWETIPFFWEGLFSGAMLILGRV